MTTNKRLVIVEIILTLERILKQISNHLDPFASIWVKSHTPNVWSRPVEAGRNVGILLKCRSKVSSISTSYHLILGAMNNIFHKRWVIYDMTTAWCHVSWRHSHTALLVFRTWELRQLCRLRSLWLLLVVSLVALAVALVAAWRENRRQCSEWLWSTCSTQSPSTFSNRYVTQVYNRIEHVCAHRMSTVWLLWDTNHNRVNPPPRLGVVHNYQQYQKRTLFVTPPPSQKSTLKMLILVTPIWKCNAS